MSAISGVHPNRAKGTGAPASNAESFSAAASITGSNSAPPYDTTLIRGRIDRKRKYHDHISLAIRVRNDQPPELIMVEKSNPSMLLPLEACFVGAVIEARVDAPINGDHEEKGTIINVKNKHKSVLGLSIIRSSPDPNAIQACLRLVAEGYLSMTIFSNPENTTCFLQSQTEAKEVLLLDSKDSFRKAFVKRLVKGLKGELDVEDLQNGMQQLSMQPRRRPAHIKRKQRDILLKLEKSQSPLEEVVKKIETDSDDTSTGNDPIGEHASWQKDYFPISSLTSSVSAVPMQATYNLPDPDDPNLQSGRHPKTRREYLKDKKWPQIQWLLNRLVPIIEALREKKSPDQKWLEILDVGGGRGDIAVAVAEAFEDTRVTVVDINESSLKGGRSYYQSRKQWLSSDNTNEDRVRFLCGDFAEYARSGFNPTTPERNQFDVVIAWHACGDLSDYALEFSVQHDNAKAFVICPCCYTKRHIRGFQPSWIQNYCTIVLTKEEKKEDSTSKENSNQEMKLDEEIATIQRLAEINERPEITHRAMKLINTMRLRALLNLSAKSDSNNIRHLGEMNPDAASEFANFSISLEEYNIAHSSKNLVLVGIQK